MAARKRPTASRRGSSGDDGGDLHDVAIIAMTIRHGADYTKRYLDARALAEIREDDA